MIAWVLERVRAFAAEPAAAGLLERSIAGGLALLLSGLVYGLGAAPLRRVVRRIAARTASAWDDLLFGDAMLRALSGLMPLWILYQATGLVLAGLGRAERFAGRLLLAVLTGLALRIATLALDAVERIYRGYTVSRSRPIKAFVQLATVFSHAVALILVASLLLDRPAWGFLSGLGALSAVLMLVFKDSLLGLAASFQISANHMVEIGDWIEMPQYNADGDVIDISLLTVKVRNWDRTITVLPITALVSDAFKNWRGMTESGGRRIMRNLWIDVRSVRFCDADLLAGFRRIQILRDYVERKTGELERYNAEHGVDATVAVNGRRLTNLGTFRAYMVEYLRRHPGLRQDMTLMVRQLEAGPQGVALQVYAFTATTAWIEYEAIQADIFDHLLAALDEFGLRAYQNPSGWDVAALVQAMPPSSRVSPAKPSST